MEYFEEFPFSDSFFEAEEKYDQEFSHFDGGADVQSDGSEVDQAEMEAALYSQIHFEPNDIESTVHCNSPMGKIELFVDTENLDEPTKDQENKKGAKKKNLKKHKENASKGKGETHNFKNNIIEISDVENSIKQNKVETISSVCSEIERQKKPNQKPKLKNKNKLVDNSNSLKNDKSSGREIVNGAKVVIEIDSDSDYKGKLRKKKSLPVIKQFLSTSTQDTPAKGGKLENIKLSADRKSKPKSNLTHSGNDSVTDIVEKVDKRSSISPLCNPFKAMSDKLSGKKFNAPMPKTSTLADPSSSAGSDILSAGAVCLYSPSKKASVIVIDSDREEIDKKTGRKHPKKIVKQNKNVRCSSGSSSSDSDNSVNFLLDSDSGGDDDININVSGLNASNRNIELNCEKLPDWDDMNITVEDVHKTQSNQGWKINDVDKYGIQGSSSRYYTKSRIVCNNCNERGHISKVCPKPQKTPVCILCGLEGHNHFRCPDKSLCFNCERPGHNKSDCLFPWHRKFDFCKRCSMKGHSVTECPDIWRRYHLTTITLNIVQGEHRNFQQFQLNKKVFCYNCAAEGHFGHECRELMMDKHKYAHWPLIVSYREPPNHLPNKNWKELRIEESSNSASKRKRDYSAQPPASKKQKKEKKQKDKKKSKSSKVEYKHAGDFIRSRPDITHFYDNNEASASGQEQLSKKQTRNQKRQLKRQGLRYQLEQEKKERQDYLPLGKPKAASSKQTIKKQTYWKRQKEEKKINKAAKRSYEHKKESRHSNSWNQQAYSKRGFRKY